MALVTHTRIDEREKGNTLCSYCNKYSHEADNCFVLKGYPNWWGDRPRGDGPWKRVIVCSIRCLISGSMLDLAHSTFEPNTDIVQTNSAYPKEEEVEMLGIEVACGPDGFVLCQRKNTLDIISEAGLLGSRPTTIPLEQNHRLALPTSPNTDALPSVSSAEADAIIEVQIPMLFQMVIFWSTIQSPENSIKCCDSAATMAGTLLSGAHIAYNGNPLDDLSPTAWKLFSMVMFVFMLNFIPDLAHSLCHGIEI
ncbi:hypothetical protein SADUNF_Sadunf03G0044600 [Salix dunnii]|uniref:Uncharacterized protein n=1 Tax=Salix dunnii TaxID=1413687 RepID=A0A835N390_9ROSI|nr:hypothetical protein SADUNF_Sadunf03G0044600 [Salix dunnii]